MDLYAFWSYDLFPYVCGGEVVRIDDEGYVHPKNYQGYRFRPFYVLPRKKGEELMVRIKTLTGNYKRAERVFREEWARAVADLFPVDSRPKELK